MTTQTSARRIDPACVQGLGDLPQGRCPTTLNLPHDRDHIGRALVCVVNNFSCRLLARLVNLWVAERNATRLSGCQGLRSALMKRARSFRASAANKCGMKESTSDISAQRPTCSPGTISGSQATNSSSSTLASFRSGVTKPSVNKLWTGSEKTRAVQQSTLVSMSRMRRAAERYAFILSRLLQSNSTP